jgi:alkylated DNA repair dioxygenase AlkB
MPEGAMYYRIVTQCAQNLKNVESWLDKAEQHAADKKFGIAVLLNGRLAPDQKPFIYQVQSACDYLKAAAGWLSGQAPPKHPDTEQTMGELRAQEDLFASAGSSLAIDLSFATAKRIPLDAQSWVEVVPGWISGSHGLFARLAAAVPWLQHDRRLFDQTFREPRLTAEYRNLRDVPDRVVLETANALSQRYGVVYDSLWLNYYRDGQDSTSWHRDRFSCRRPDCIVPVLTLGTTRRFLLKPRRGGRSIAFKPASGDLIVMGGRSQEDWMHSVPKDPGIAEPRISINFQSSSQARRAT